MLLTIKALHEIYRILVEGGMAIITVPQKDNLEETFEDSSIRTAEGRIKYFGHEDHL